MQDEKRAGGDGRNQRPDETLADILDRLSYRRVRLSDQTDPIFRLRYDAYRREDFIPINSQMILEDHWDSAPNAEAFGIYIDDRLVSSLRIHAVRSVNDVSPSRTLWPEVLSPFLEAGLSYIDPTRFTADHDASLAFPLLPLLTLRIAVMASDHFDVDYCIGAVRREHGAFYRRVFRSELMGDERIFTGLRFPMYLYVADVRATLQTLYRRYPVFRSLPSERAALFNPLPPGTIPPPVRPTALLALKEQLEQQEQV